MLYEFMDSLAPALAGAAIAVLAIGLAGVVVMRRLARIDARVGLVVKAAYQNTSEIRQNTDRIGRFSGGLERLLEQSRAGIEYQRKAHDQERVLLASLNKQMRHLETLLDRAAPAGAATPTKPVAAKAARPAPVANGEPARAAAQGGEIAATRFSELFDRTAARAANAADTGNREEGSAMLLAKLFERDAVRRATDTAARPTGTADAPQNEADLQDYRKVSNG